MKDGENDLADFQAAIQDDVQMMAETEAPHPSKMVEVPHPSDATNVPHVTPEAEEDKQWLHITPEDERVIVGARGMIMRHS